MSQPRWGLVCAAAVGFVLILSCRETWSQAVEPAPPNKDTAEKADAKPAKPASILPLAPRDRKAYEKISAALDEPTQLEFIETPLSEVIDYLKDLHGIEIELDQKALDAAGVALDIPVTRNLKGVRLQSALDLMLKQLDLTWKIDHEVLVITSIEESIRRPEIRVYPVADLTESVGKDGKKRCDYDSLIKVLESVTGIAHMERASAKQTDAIVDEKAADKTVQPVDKPAPAAKRDRASVRANEASASLVIVCDRATHEEIGLLLTALRQARELKIDARPEKAKKGNASSAATPVFPVGSPRDLAARAKTEKSLDRELSLDLAKVPLMEACDLISDQLKLNIQIDQRALDAAGVAIDVPVDLKIRRVAGRTALDRLLTPLDLNYCIQHESLIITSREVAEGPVGIELCIYPARDMGNTLALLETIRDCIPPSDSDDGDQDWMLVPFERFGLVVAKLPREDQERVARLLRALRTARDQQGIEPATEVESDRDSSGRKN